MEALARYVRATDEASNLTKEELARKTLQGKAAALLGAYGKGRIFLLGPHFEHPDFRDSNKVIGSAMMMANRSRMISTERTPGPSSLVGIRRALSEARVAYSGLEGARWTIGRKVWEHEKIGYFVNAMWGRLQSAERCEMALRFPEDLEEELRAFVRMMRGIRKEMRMGLDTTKQAELMFEALSSATATFFNAYFRCKLQSLTG